MRAPDFFILGAPKTGSTALAQWLREHPAIFFSDPKEPYFWAEDLSELREWTGVPDLDTYLGLFRGVEPWHRAVGEGSTIYLLSRAAVPRIIENDPMARFLVLLRNPVELAHAFHGQLCFHGFEDERDFGKAWALQEVRRDGRQLPRHALCSALLQYRDVVSLGEQVERLLEQVPREQVQILLFDELRASPLDVYRRVLGFLDVEDDGRRSFEVINASRVPRSRRLNRWLRSALPRALGSWFKNHLSDANRRRASGLLSRIMGREQGRSPLDSHLRECIELELRDDVSRLERVTGLDLAAWKSGSSPVSADR